MSRTREIRGVSMGEISHLNRAEGLAALRKGCCKPRGCQEGGVIRHRDQAVKRPQGRCSPGVPEELRGG